MAEPPRMNDQRLETIIGRLLQVGVAIAAALVLVGGFMYLGEHRGAAIDRSKFQGEPLELESVVGIASLAVNGDAEGLIQLGILVLIATPIARVVFSVYAFGLERDRLYVVVTLIVLALLIVGLI